MQHSSWQCFLFFRTAERYVKGCMSLSLPMLNTLGNTIWIATPSWLTSAASKPTHTKLVTSAYCFLRWQHVDVCTAMICLNVVSFAVVTAASNCCHSGNCFILGNSRHSILGWRKTTPEVGECPWKQTEVGECPHVEPVHNQLEHFPLRTRVRNKMQAHAGI